MPQYLLIERVNGVETEAADYRADLGSGVGIGSEMTRETARVWVIVETRETDRGVALVIEPKGSSYTGDPHDARMELGNWFMKMLEELDEDRVDDAEAIDVLKGKIAETFADWRRETGYGLGGRGTGPSAA